MGRPLITSDIPGCREAVANGTSGLLVQARNAEQLYQAMKQMLYLNREKRKAMGLAGRNKMEQEFDKAVVVADTIAGLGI